MTISVLFLEEVSPQTYEYDRDDGEQHYSSALLGCCSSLC